MTNLLEENQNPTTHLDLTVIELLTPNNRTI